MAALALIDVILYVLSQNSTSALLALITSGIYFVLTVLEIGLIPVCAAGAIFFWITRIVGKRLDGRIDCRSDLHTWINLALIVLSLIWAVAKIVFLVGEFSV